MIENKNIQDKKYILGQFFTPQDICKNIVDRIDFSGALIVEPSFGSGNFLDALKDLPNEKIGIELDDEVYTTKYDNETTKTFNKNFYDWTIKTDKKLIFIGNPPYRTPAYSLSTHKKYVLSLTKKYNCSGIREEAVFFILHTIDIIKQNGGIGEIHYILPTSLLKNNSKFFTSFKKFLRDECRFINIETINGNEFDEVSQDLICLSLEVGGEQQQTVKVDGIDVSLNEYLCLEDSDYIPFQKIFKQTYLGSVPCESLLMSVEGETKEHFKERLCSIISSNNITEDELYEKLQYNGKFHLKVLNGEKDSSAVKSKIKIILSYVKNIQEKENILDEFNNIENYKEINGRNNILYYFRCEKLKRNKNFVYELNPNPCKSFYFTGNPSHSSTDYFGFCDYDINRNVSPGANRTVPIINIEDNLTDTFKKWWKTNTDEPFSEIFNYIIYVSKTSWYKERKQNNKRFYFGIPTIFYKDFKKSIDS